MSRLSREPLTCAKEDFTLRQHPRNGGIAYSEHGRNVPTVYQNYAHNGQRTGVTGTLEIFWCGGPGNARLELDGIFVRRWSTDLENPARVQVSFRSAARVSYAGRCGQLQLRLQQP